ncbi:helicase HerA domain-containing protein [Tolypothrix sp. VBCCA 56010]|uniref:helicase HerA domain-containing protein n=1 Tax=Tolypothrix sp. VBCCA 56010 TaxID=3137731 RepID=UPI003D7DB867
MKSTIIPVDALKSHAAILGKTGSGKTYAAKSQIELLLREGRQVAIVDPTDAWYGLRSGADGKAEGGHDVLILGGPHGDLPLTPSSGKVCARLVYSPKPPNVIFCTIELTIGERTAWFTDFASELFRISDRRPLHLAIDEVHCFAPQGKVPDPQTGKMLHAANQLFSGGRSRGLRVLAISQRPAKVHKDALTSIETLVAMRMIAPQDREAVKAWIDGCGDPASGRDVLNSLASLRVGEAWVWWPAGGHLQRVMFPKIESYDSSSTPDDDRKGVRALPVTWRAIDLEALKGSLGEAAKEAEENDPKALRKRIGELKTQLEHARTDKPVGADPQVIADANRLKFIAPLVNENALEIGACVGQIRAVMDHLEKIKVRLLDMSRLESVATTQPSLTSAEPQQPRANAQKKALPPGGEIAGLPEDAPLGKAEKLIMAYLSRGPRAGMNKITLAILCGYAHSGGGFNNALSRLRTLGQITTVGIGIVRQATRGPGSLCSLYQIHDTRSALRWANEVGKAERLILNALAQDGAMPKEELAKRTGYEATGGGFNNALSALRSLGLITSYEGRIDLSAEMNEATEWEERYT